MNVDMVYPNEVDVRRQPRRGWLTVPVVLANPLTLTVPRTALPPEPTVPPTFSPRPFHRPTLHFYQVNSCSSHYFILTTKPLLSINIFPAIDCQVLARTNFFCELLDSSFLFFFFF